jgi:hypothetical protein
MDNEPELNEPELIREQMEQTRASLTEKLETLEHQVVDTVHDATTAVADTVETVKEAVQGTVETVKDTFDVRVQVERHPWAMMGASVALGYLGGRLLRVSASDHYRQWRSVPAAPDEPPWPSRHNDGHPHRLQGPESSNKKLMPEEPLGSNPGWLRQMAALFQPEIAKLRGLAVGAVLSMARDMITDSAPEQLKPQLAEVVDSITVKLGGEPVHSLSSKNGYHI